MAERRRRRRALFGLLAGLLLAAAGAELGFRYLLFGESAWARHVGAPLRRAGRFADPSVDDDFWKLQHLFTPPEKRHEPRGRHAELGWVSGSLAAPDLRHEDEPALGDRRPVLLFGDSFARCAFPPRYCWQGLLARSPQLSRRFHLLNHGVRGYGLDQTLLLLRAVLPRWRERSPVVVFSLLVDDDLDRCALRFRGRPKPWLELVDGELVAHAPGDVGTDEWLRAHPPGIRSYAWRFLSKGWTWLPRFLRAPAGLDPARLEAKRALCRAILEEAHAVLEAAGVEHFVLLFHGEATIARAPGEDWRERLVLEACVELGMPWVSSRAAILADSEATGTPLAEYFLDAGEALWMAGHYDHRGNRAAFGALRRGLNRRFDG